MRPGILLALTLSFFGSAFPAAAGDPDPGTIRVEWRTSVDANGDGHESIVIDFAKRDFETIKKMTREVRDVLRSFPGARADRLIADDSTYAYDEGTTAAVFERHLIGAARPTAGGDSEVPVAGRVTFITDKEENGRTIFYFTGAGEAFGAPWTGKVSVVLPPGSTHASWDQKAAVVRFAPPAVGQGGRARLHADLEVRDPLMTCAYKVYAQPESFPDWWVARATIRNEGDGAARDFRVRFRIEGHTEWSDWRPAGLVAPGQTLVVPWYPVLGREIAGLTASAPTRVNVEWSSGGGATESASKPIQLLGGHEFHSCGTMSAENFGAFSDIRDLVPFIAAWVSRDDLVVKEFAGMASRNVRGAAANMGTEACMKLIKACYDIMIQNGFVYKAPPYIRDTSVKFESNLVQNVKYPRDVIRDKSGTCIDLAILQAAMYHTLGMRPYLAFVPGHVFPVARLEDGTFVSVESTGILGGCRPADSLTFAEAHKMADQEFLDNQKDGTLLLVDLWEEWSRGIANPELDVLPADILQKWGITQKGALGGIVPGKDPDLDPSGFSGTWVGEITAVLGGNPVTIPCTLVIQLAEEERHRLFMSFDVEAGGRKTHVEEEGVGENQDGQLVFQGLLRTVGGEKADAGRGAARIKDGKLTGRYGDDTKGFKPFTFERKK